MSKAMHNPQWPIKKAVSTFHRQTLESLLEGARTQHVFPTEIYPGFRKVNEERKRKAHGDHNKGWFASGEGANSFEGRIVSDDSAGNVTLQYLYRAYMKFVDIGVMAGVKAGDVERSKKAKYDKRYISAWSPFTSYSHRPNIQRTLAHTETRLGTYLRDFYGWDFIDTITSIEDKAIEVVLQP